MFFIPVKNKIKAAILINEAIFSLYIPPTNSEEKNTTINNINPIKISNCAYLFKRLFALPNLLSPSSLDISVVITRPTSKSKKRIAISTVARVKVTRPKSKSPKNLIKIMVVKNPKNVKITSLVESIKIPSPIFLAIDILSYCPRN